MSEQPREFSFTPEMRAKADAIIAKYPEGRQRSAVIPLLDLAQRQAGGWLPRAAVMHVAEVLDMAEIRVWEVATFYTMFNLKPVGRTCIDVCTTTPCWLRGSADIVAALEDEIGVKLGGTTEDGRITLVREEECLAGCCGAPMMVVDGHYHENLDLEQLDAILEGLE